MRDIAATGEREPLGRISVLEDLDDDGKMDKKTVFLDKLVLPRALKVLDHGVLVGEPPNLWLARDTDGDLRADTKELVTNTYGRLEANVEHNANSLALGTRQLDAHVRDRRLPAAEERAFEVRKTLARGQWGASQDDAGRIYRNSNESVLHVDLGADAVLRAGIRIWCGRAAATNRCAATSNEVNMVWPVRPTPGVNRGYQAGVLRPDGRLASYTAVSSPTVYRGDHLPSELRGNVFVVDPAANVVSRIIIQDDGTRLVARKAYEHDRVPRPRPTNVSGRSICRTRQTARSTSSTCITASSSTATTSPSICATRSCRGSWKRRSDTDGSTGSCTRRRAAGRRPSLSKQSPAQLVDLLSHPNGWLRDTAQRLLVERGDRDRRLVVEKEGGVCAGRDDAASRALDARRTRQPRWGHGRARARRFFARRARVSHPAVRALAIRTRSSASGGGAEARTRS